MVALRKVALSVALWSGLSACVNLPGEVRAELECAATVAEDHFGSESCPDSAR